MVSKTKTILLHRGKKEKNLKERGVFIIMKKVMMLALVMVVLGMNASSVMACENQISVCDASEHSRLVIQSDIVCPACGAIGYPTGKISFGYSLRKNESRFLPIYQEMMCSENSGHIWYVYLADATQ